MALFRSSNPAMKDSVYSKVAAGTSSNTMTVNGTVNKTLVLLGLAVLSGAYTWRVFTSSNNPEAFMPWMWGGLIAGLVFALIAIFKPSTTPWSAPLYAIGEGLFLGAISAVYEYAYAASFPGIVITAVSITALTLLVMLVLYRTRVIVVTQKLRAGIIVATGAIALFYIIALVASLFGATGISQFLAGSSLLSIGVSVVVVIIAAMNLLLDFDFVEKGVKAQAPKYMEWYGAFGLMVTLVWLYLEILRLLSKISNR